MGRRRRVAVCADDSPGSMRACRYAAQHVLDRDTDVDLVTAVRETPTTDPRGAPPRKRKKRRFRASAEGKKSAAKISRGGLGTQKTSSPRSSSVTSPLPPSPPLARRRAAEEGERVLDFHRAQLELCQMPAARVRKVIVRCRPRESAASAVLRAVKDADAVVCGSRFGRGAEALLGVAGLGSVSLRKLVRGSRVPVTVVPSTTPVPEMITAREGADASAETKKRQR